MSTARKLGPDLEVKPYEDASGGWGSVRSLVKSLARDRVQERFRPPPASAAHCSQWLCGLRSLPPQPAPPR